MTVEDRGRNAPFLAKIEFGNDYKTKKTKNNKSIQSTSCPNKKNSSFANPNTTFIVKLVAVFGGVFLLLGSTADKDRWSAHQLVAGPAVHCGIMSSPSLRILGHD